MKTVAWFSGGASSALAIKTIIEEIAKEGHAGWGNTMILAAERLEALNDKDKEY